LLGKGAAWLRYRQISRRKLYSALAPSDYFPHFPGLRVEDSSAVRRMPHERDTKVHRNLSGGFVGMGFIRKALFVATLGLSGRVFRDDSKKERTAKANAQRVRPRKQTKVTRAKPQATRRAKPQATRRAKPQATRRAKPQAARRPKPQAAHRSTVAPIVGAGNGTSIELERIADLHVRGALTDEEFAAAKAKILGTSLSPSESRRDPATFPAVEANVAAARHLADLAAHDDASVTTFSSD
jgi:Short C-terminal domain